MNMLDKGDRDMTYPRVHADFNNVNKEGRVRFNYMQLLESPQLADTVVTTKGTIFTPQGVMEVPCTAMEVSDGTHTFGELYDHISALFMRLCLLNPRTSWKSNSSRYRGINGTGEVTYLVGTKLPLIARIGSTIAWYLPQPLWDKLPIAEVKKVRAPWSAYSSANVEAILGRPITMVDNTSTVDYITTPQGVMEVPCPVGMVANPYSISNGRYQLGQVVTISNSSHTFNQLYDLRDALFVALSHFYMEYGGAGYKTWKSLYQVDGTMHDDIFIAGIKLPRGMVAYQLPMKLWDVLNSPKVGAAPYGYNPPLVLQMLLQVSPNDR